MVYKDYSDYSKSKGYKSLAFFIQTEIIYDFTVEFCKLYVDYRSRTKDQMEQAGRSGKQNIAEAYLLKSIEGRLKLLSVSRASLEELLNDYLDFLRQRGLVVWEMDSPKAQVIRRLAYNHYKSYKRSLQGQRPYKNYKVYIADPEAAANTMVCLINQTSSLLDEKLRWLEEKFVKEGGFRENLFKKRLDYKNSTPAN